MENDYTLRLVAEAAAKACYICYRPSAHVLIDKSNSDFFYICKSHLTDKGFATRVDPPVDTAKLEEEARKKKLAAEVDKVTKEWKEKQDSKGDKEKDDKDDAEKVKEMILKDKNLPKEPSDTEEETPEPESRKYTLHPAIYSQRVRKKQEIANAKKKAEQLRSMQFPGVPKGLPGQVATKPADKPDGKPDNKPADDGEGGHTV